MTEIEVMHMTTNNQPGVSQEEKQPLDILQRIKERKQVMKQAAIDLVEGIGLPQEAWHEVLPTLFAYSDPQNGAFVGQEDLTSINAVDAPERSSQSAQRDVDAILEQANDYIVLLARRSIPKSITQPAFQNIEVDELAQMVRIKLWQTLERQPIMSLKPYIRSIVRSEAIRSRKDHRLISSLPLNVEGELTQGRLLATAQEGMGDPSVQVERNEMLDNFLVTLVSFIAQLPPLQQNAMICSLQENVDDVERMKKMLQYYGLDIMAWPESRFEQHRLRASLSIARKKLAQLRKDIDNTYVTKNCVC